LKEFGNISVITVVKNSVSLIEQTLISIFGQTYRDIELIIIDGKSIDGTLDIIANYKDQISSFISEEDNGIFDAMNKGVSYCSGEWVCFLNAGDTFVDRKSLENLSDNWDRKSKIILSNTRILDKNGALESFYKADINKIKFNTPAFHQSQIVRSELLKSRPYDCYFNLTADYDFILYHHLTGELIQHVDFDTINFLGGGISSKHRGKAMVQSLAIMAKYSVSFDAIMTSHWYLSLIETRDSSIDNYDFSIRFNKLQNQVLKLRSKYDKIALYGNGKISKFIQFLLEDNFVFCTDASLTNTPNSSENIKIGEIHNRKFDKIIVSVLGREKEIIDHLQNDFSIPLEKIFIFEL
jgi:glycosyltransferase involved in cell wall biosynthesis